MYIDKIKTILSDFEEDSFRWESYSQRINIYSILLLISRGIANGDSALIEAIDSELIILLEDLALNQNLVPDHIFLVNNAIWDLGQISTIEEHNTQSIQILTTFLDLYSYLSEPYLRVVSALDKFNNCETANPGETICKEDIIPEIEEMLFPYEYIFDDGALVVKTSLDLETIQELYHAIKQVQAQLNRITETIIPLANDPNGVLTIIIYADPDEYNTYQTFLYGLPTNNGGIYIEQWGIFFTYQRSEQESIYSLEELTRHEYVHYLVGRYLIDGFWGEEEIYNNNRMVWFDEGLAEFLAWSTPSDGVKTRKLLVEQVESDGPDRLTVDQILTSTYSDFKFYRYAGLFFNYLYLNDIETLRNLLLYAHNSDITSFDNLVNQMRTDPELEENFQNFLNRLVNDVNNLNNPSTIFPDISSLDLADPVKIQETFRTTRLGYLGKCSVAATNINSRFSCRGVLTGQLTNKPNESDVWGEFNADIDEIIQELNVGSKPNNFQGMNCRFGPIYFDEYQNTSQFYPSADYFCDGPLREGNFALLDAVSQITFDFNSTRLGINANCTLVSDVQVLCKKQLTTRSYKNSVSDNVLELELNKDLSELQNQVYAIRPSYYRDFSCNFQGEPITIPYGDSKKYLLQEVECVVKI
ncbi:collagenase [Candidatus Woesearchaeota archaeon]|nr:collagenase [Candidatus Woesearchaeota archaeon]